MSTCASRENPCALVVTIDVEADDEWESGLETSYANISTVPRFQELCDRYGVRPTYLVAYDVTTNVTARSILQELARHGNCEIGAHTHGWRTPPFIQSFDDDPRLRPFLYEYPFHIQKEKLARLTDRLTEVFDTAVLSHRAGRWGIDAQGIALLRALGYLVDTSVVPLRSWRSKRGAVTGMPGPSFLEAPHYPYYPAHDAVDREGGTDLLEVPVTVTIRGLMRGLVDNRRLAGLLHAEGRSGRLLRRGLRGLGLARVVPLQPASERVSDLMALCDELIIKRVPVINMAFHSSELALGCSPSSRTEADQQRVWDSLTAIFERLAREPQVKCLTLTEYAESYQRPFHESTHDGEGVQLRVPR